jgi:microcystin-dependent protein
MAQPYVGEIRMFAGSFAPVGWAFCNGQLLSISENETLFQLIGTAYGGDGQQTFALPDLRGRVPVHQGNGAAFADAFGVENVTLTISQIPSHVHSHVAVVPAGNTTPLGKLAADTGPTMIYADGQGAALASASATATAGGSQPHDNMMPFLGIHFIISLFGIFPSQT